FPSQRALGVPFAEAISPAFMREVADVHRELYAEQAELYGENVAVKIERCLAVTDSEYEAGIRARETYRERLLAILDGVDLLLTPTLACVAPVLGPDELSRRELLIPLTYPFNAIGAPALALPSGHAAD